MNELEHLAALLRATGPIPRIQPNTLPGPTFEYVPASRRSDVLMGVIDLPRVTFSGFTYWNPSTMNNNDQQPNYDPSSATLNWSWLERHGLRGRDGLRPLRHDARRPAPSERRHQRRRRPGRPAGGVELLRRQHLRLRPGRTSPSSSGRRSSRRPPRGTTVSGFTNGAAEACRRRRSVDRPADPAQRRHGRREARRRRPARPVELADLRRHGEPRVAGRSRRASPPRPTDAPTRAGCSSSATSTCSRTS